jgi:hypothetical protein
MMRSLLSCRLLTAASHAFHTTDPAQVAFEAVRAHFFEKKSGCSSISSMV